MRGLVVAILILALWPASAATAQLPPSVAPQGRAPLPCGQHDAGGFLNVLPPGQNGLATLPQIAAFEASGARPAHNDDQLAMYRDLL